MNKDLLKGELVANGFDFEEANFGFIIKTKYGRKVIISVFGGWDNYNKNEGVQCEVLDEGSIYGYKYCKYRKTIKSIITYIKNYI